MDSQPKPKADQPESTKTLFVFFTFGFLGFWFFSTILAGAEDLLVGFSSSTGMIWVFVTLPITVSFMIIPYFFDRLPPLLLILLLFPLAACGLLALYLGQKAWLKCLGVTILALFSVSDVTAVSLTAYFGTATVKYYCWGTGIGNVVGPLYYTAMTSWFHVSSMISISIIAIMHPTLFLSCYLMLEKRREKVIDYKKIVNNSDLSEDLQEDDPKQKLSISEKLHSALKIVPKLTQIFLGILAHDLVLSGITTTIAFPDSPFSSADHYKYYLIMSFTGLCLGRSYLGVAEYIKTGLSDKLLVRRTWTLVLITGCHVVLLIFDSLYRFIPNVWVILFLVFSLGFWGEAIYLNIAVILGEIEDPRVKELCMGLAGFGMGCGALIGAIISAPIENVLVKHCLQTIGNQTSYCLTRETKHVFKN